MTAQSRKAGLKRGRSRAPAPSPQTYNSVDVSGIRRKQIIAAVRSIISKYGLEAVTIANIATELGTSRGVVVYHFQNKEEILHEVLTSAMSDADASALHFERGAEDPADFVDIIADVAKLAKTSSDWWRIYFAFLSQAHVNKFYQDALAWSDKRYRTALAKKLGDEKRAVIVLALMKGIAMQVSVTSDLQIEPVVQELRVLLQRWRPARR